MDPKELPLGLAMALSMNAPAMERFTALSGGDRDDFIRRARTVGSKREMQRLVDSLAGGDMQ